MIEIHTKMCAQQGITARLEHCKQKQKEKNKSTKDQAKKQGVKHARAPISQQKTRARDRVPSNGDSKGSDDDADSVVDVVDVDAGGIPESILDERVSGGVKQYLITWLNLPESYNSWELASEYDDGVYGGAYVELVQEWEEYKRTDPQYEGPTTTPTPTRKQTSKKQQQAKPPKPRSRQHASERT